MNKYEMHIREMEQSGLYRAVEVSITHLGNTADV